MNLQVLYFSGTGNTDYVAHYLARRMARKLVHLPIEIDLRSIEWQPAQVVDDFDLLAVGFPVYAGDSPDFVRAYLGQLPLGKGRGVFVFCTKGAFAAGAVRSNLQRLATQGYVPLGGGSVTMPGTDGLSFVSKGSWMARKALEKDYDRLKDADHLVEQMACVLSDLADGCPPEALRLHLTSRPRVAVSDWIWASLYRATEEYARSRFRADERCEGCGLCARICPVGSVEMRNGRPLFSEHCALCMRCLHACPQEAIQIGGITVNKFRWKGPKGDFKPLRMRPG